MNENEDLNSEVPRKIHYRTHDGVHEAIAQGGEPAIDAVLRAERDRGEGATFTCSCSALGYDGSSQWQVEARGNEGYLIYEVLITILSERGTDIA